MPMTKKELRGNIMNELGIYVNGYLPPDEYWEILDVFEDIKETHEKNNITEISNLYRSLSTFLDALDKGQFNPDFLARFLYDVEELVTMLEAFYREV